MNKTEKGILIFYSILAISYLVINVQMNQTYANVRFPNETPSLVSGLTDKYENTVDHLYREILHRPADKTGLMYYSDALRSGKMTVDDIRNALANSSEAKAEESSAMLNETTEKTITQLYSQILHRGPDIHGMSFYGSSLENGKMTVGDIRNALANSDEAKMYMAPNEFMPVYELSNSTKDTITNIYVKVFDRTPLANEMAYYGSYLQNGRMTPDQIQSILMSEKSGQ